jgi:hypothetical protein
MKHCRPWMLIGCLGILALILLLPRLGVGAASGGLLLTLLMVGCCVLPMLLVLLPRGKDGTGGCCGDDKTDSAPSKPGGEKSEQKTPSCH